MRVLPRGPASLALSAALVSSLLVPAVVSLPATAAEHEVAVDRLAGSGRIETAIAISADAFSTAEIVVLARADDYADALTGATVAAKVGGPLLLTPSDALPQVVLDELVRLDAQEVYILGGEAAVSSGVEGSLQNAGLTTHRLAGSNRFATAAAVARWVSDGSASTAFVVEGVDADPTRGWPDALSAAWYAAQQDAVLVLVDTDTVPASSESLLEELGVTNVVIVGGEAAVSSSVADELSTLVGEDGSVRRISGASRYETSALVYDEAVMNGASAEVRYVVTGRSFADALGAGAAAAALNQTLLLVDGVGLETSPISEDRLGTMTDLLERVVLAGGTSAIDADAATMIQDAVTYAPQTAAFCLTVLHNNDGESQIVNASGEPDFGGIARFASVVKREQAAAVSERPDGCTERGVLTVTSGDNFLAGPELNASFDKGVPWYDSIALDYLEYDALAIGNHDFDFGPSRTADFISGFEGDAVFLSANLDFSQEPELQSLVDAGQIAPSTVISTGNRDIGVIGLTTPALRSISSPRNVQVDSDVLGAVQQQVQDLDAAGVDLIVLISHLQSIQEDLDLVGDLTGVDIVVAGGGDEVLGSPGQYFVPGDGEVIAGAYPMTGTDADGEYVPVVTTAGEYKYLGRLVARFGDDNELLAEDAVDPTRSRMVRIAGSSLPDGVAADSYVQSNVVDPVAEYVADLAETVIGTSEVGLNGARPDIRVDEQNLGNLMADALVYTVEQNATDFGIDPDAPMVGLQNGGGIRNSNVIPAGDLTLLTTFNVAPFSNFVGAFESVSPETVKLLLENAYSGVENVDGRFGHLSGMSVEVDLDAVAQTRDDDGNITESGSRVVNVTLDDGTPLIVDGAVADGAPDVTFVTIDFLARGGDQYPFPDFDTFTTVGTTYQQSLRNYIVDGLGGVVSAEDYPEGGEGRITFL